MTKIKFKIRETADTLPVRLRVEAKSFRDSNPLLTNLLKQAADKIEELETYSGEMNDIIMRLERRLNERENFAQHD